MNASSPAACRPLRRRRAALVAALLLTLAACGVEAGDTTATSAAGPDDGIVGSDVEETTTTEATTTTLPEVQLDIAGDDGSELNQVAGNAIEDLEAFWADAYPEAYGDAYEPLSGGLFAIDSSTSPRGIPCAGRDIEELLDNAFYCPEDDAVVWDQERFMPELGERYGAFTVAVVIAHEWGHVIQGRSGFDGPSVIVELQADCFAGAWAAHELDGDDTRFEVTTDDLDQALAGVLSLRDAPGGSADDPLAHGSGFDRVGAFQDGFEDGVERCAEFMNGDPTPFQWEFNADEELTGGDLPLSTSEPDDDILDLAFPVLDAYWTDTFPQLDDGQDWDPLGQPIAFGPDDRPNCDGEPVEGLVLFVCVPDRYVGFELEETFSDIYDQNGDFGVATLLATQYGRDVVRQLASADDELHATLQGDCFAGSFAGAILPDENGESPYDLVLSPGDLDESVGALLTFRSAEARERSGPGFDRARAFRTGVLQGPEACTDL